MGLPNLQLDYWAANMQKIVHWAFFPETQWCQLELHSCSSSLKALICHANKIKPKQYSGNPIVINTLRIWQQIEQRCDWNTLSLNTPICNNELFKPAKIDAGFSLWDRQGLTKIVYCYTEGIFSIFTQLCTAFNPQQSELLRYFQLRHFLKSNTPSFPFTQPSWGFDNLLLVTKMARQHISFVYDLLAPDTPMVLLKIKT